MSEGEKEAARAEMQEWEAKLLEAKVAGTDATAIKLQLREARQRFRQFRDANPDPLGPGDATVQAGVN